MRALIIGGGIAGLGTAALLAADGHEVVLLEARDVLGGRAGSYERDGFRFDTGPSWYLMPEVFDHFFRLLGTTTEAELDLVDLSPAFRVFPEPDADRAADPVDVVTGRGEVAALFEGRESGAGARVLDYLDSAEDAYRLAVDRFLYDPYLTAKGLLDPTLLRRVPTLAPLLTRPLASHVERRFDDTVLQQILGYPAVFLGGSPYEMPSLYHLMSHLDLADGVRYPRGGFTELIAAVARVAARHGATLRTGAPVARILTEHGAAVGVQLADGERLDADLVVSAADLHHTETSLLAEDERSYPESWWRQATPSTGALLLMLGVRGHLPQLAHHNLLFTADWPENFSAIFGDRPRIPTPASMYVCAPSATDDTVAPEGDTNLFVLVPIPAEPAYGRGGEDGGGDAVVEAAADDAIDQLARWIDAPDLRERIVVRRTVAPGDFAADLHVWRGNALGLAHTLRQSALFRPRNVSKKVDGLFYAGGSVLPGIGLPMCLISAELVAKIVRGDRAPGRLDEPASGHGPLGAP